MTHTITIDLPSDFVKLSSKGEIKQVVEDTLKRGRRDGVSVPELYAEVDRLCKLDNTPCEHCGISFRQYEWQHTVRNILQSFKRVGNVTAATPRSRNSKWHWNFAF
jgi:hypothetical protein